MNRRFVKTTTDVLLLIGLVVMGITGIGMYLAPPGRMARAKNWTYLGLDKHTLEDIHTYFGFMMLAIVLLHLTLNWKQLKSLLNDLSKNKSDAIIVMTAVLFVIVSMLIYLNI
ncbi:MAG: DUF4405 domain-containing protein [Archaeoglobaceae archaeon]|nr:DUF4405 domain-containing protein [Archaeoglobaceae archaeon]HDD36205.1 DUF4405 domain-containing protein [Archaeoglobus veneficus]